eukprot:SAG31_NODE_13156_length_889_cov_1.227848_2_plen_21_part_01
MLRGYASTKFTIKNLVHRSAE